MGMWTCDECIAGVERSRQREREAQRRAGAPFGSDPRVDFRNFWEAMYESSRQAPPPPPRKQPVDWPTILSVPSTATPAEIKTAYRKAALSVHPDRGGSTEAMARVNAAYDEAKRVRGEA